MRTCPVAGRVLIGRSARLRLGITSQIFLVVITSLILMLLLFACKDKKEEEDSTVDSVTHEGSEEEEDSTTDSGDHVEDVDLRVSIKNRLGREGGGNASFSVVLGKKPDSDVTVEVTSADPSEGIAAAPVLSFSADNWDMTQDVDITSQDDSTLDYAVEYEVTFSPSVGKAQTFKIYNLDNEYLLPDSGQVGDFKDIHGEDSDYDYHQPSYTVNLDALGKGKNTVTDNNTGLIWQQKDDNKERNWSEAKDYCDSFGEGWHLPDKRELFSIVSYKENSPIDTKYFPETKLYSFDGVSGLTFFSYWSSTTDFGDKTKAWQITFFLAMPVANSKDSGNYVRCVKAAPGQITTPFVVMGDQTILDKRTGLIWQREDDNEKRGWDDAIGYCEGRQLAGKNDWRLPNVRELESISDFNKSNPAIDLVVFPNTKSTYYWSSTTHAATGSSGLGEVVDFKSGSVIINQDDNPSHYVRCVRAGL